MKVFWKWWPSVMSETHSLFRYGFLAYCTILMAEKTRSRLNRRNRRRIEEKFEKFKLTESLRHLDYRMGEPDAN